jgi:hypothetical protein
MATGLFLPVVCLTAQAVVCICKQQGQKIKGSVRVFVSKNQAHILLQMRSHAVIYVSSYFYICVRILLDMCPHTVRYFCMYVSSYCSICFLILLYMCPHTALYVSSYCSICVLILLYVSSYCHRCFLPARNPTSRVFPSFSFISLSSVFQIPSSTISHAGSTISQGW